MRFLQQDKMIVDFEQCISYKDNKTIDLIAAWAVSNTSKQHDLLHFQGPWVVFRGRVTPDAPLEVCLRLKREDVSFRHRSCIITRTFPAYLIRRATPRRLSSIT